MSARVTVVVPTWNAGPEFAATLDAIRRQRADCAFEVLAIDSGSTDGTAEYLRRQSIRLIEIPNSQFNHGLTRNLGVHQSAGDLVALVTQDAMPADDYWLQRLTACFADPLVAGAYSRQLPRPDASPFVRERLLRWAATANTRRVNFLDDPSELHALDPLDRLARAAFDNVSSCVRRRVVLEFPFRACRFGEDLDWSHRVLLAGYRIVFEPGSSVIHSHNRSLWDEFRRVYFDHQNLHRLFGIHTVPRLRDVARCTASGIRHIWTAIARDARLSRAERCYWWASAVPYCFSQNLAQYLGARSVELHADAPPAGGWLDHALGRGI